MLNRGWRFALLSSIVIGNSWAASPQNIDSCLQQLVLSAAESATVATLRKECIQRLERPAELQKQAQNSRKRADIFGIKKHRPSYLLPVTWNTNPNNEAVGLAPDTLQELEMKFQLSFRVPVWERINKWPMGLHFAYTNQSWWQAYDGSRSRPFRETNHEPEFFLRWDIDTDVLGWRMRLLDIGVSHQSNGRSTLFSRSWNRVYAVMQFERGAYSFSFKPWWRVQEDPDRFADDPRGDDNPDIERFVGQAEFILGYRRDRHQFNLRIQNNLRADNRGLGELTWSYQPRWAKNLRFYTQYVTGYGESLIDYDHSVNRIGIGIALGDWF